MNMKRFALISILMLVLVFLGMYFWPRPPVSQVLSAQAATATPSLTPEKKTEATSKGLPTPVVPQQGQDRKPVKNEPDYNAIMAFGAAFKKPFTFIGKAIDENGNPVPGANVTWGANNNPDPYGSGSRGETFSDTNGMFSIKDHGIGLYVKVSKGGYYEVPTETKERGSYGSFKNTPALGKSDFPMGTEQAPAIFVLKKKGEAAGLIRAESKINLPTNGTPVEINLRNGKASALGQGDVKVECWAHVEGVDTTVYNRYSWQCRISVPGGGLVERTGPLNFTAPADNYQAVGQIDMPDTSERWRPQAMKEYFVKLANGSYARLELRIVTGSNNFLRMESYLNPQPGSRNLEYDPAKQIEVP